MGLSGRYGIRMSRELIEAIEEYCRREGLKESSAFVREVVAQRIGRPDLGDAARLRAAADSLEKRIK